MCFGDLIIVMVVLWLQMTGFIGWACEHNHHSHVCVLLQSHGSELAHLLTIQYQYNTAEDDATFKLIVSTIINCLCHGVCVSFVPRVIQQAVWVFGTGETSWLPCGESSPKSHSPPDSSGGGGGLNDSL